MTDVLVIGGGIAGLVNSILLSRAGLRVSLFEKNKFPFHRVCGEYISNEVLPFLETQNLFPSEIDLPHIQKLQLTATSGSSFEAPLDLGGFGVSRYTFDHWLASKAVDAGVKLYEGTAIRGVSRGRGHFIAETADQKQHKALVVIAAHGKRSILDKNLGRSFLKKRSPYVGVKYHALLDFEANKIALHNFAGGYCGVSRVEDEKVNICYMTHRDQLRRCGSIANLEKEVLFKNPHLRKAFQDARFLFDTPKVINEISFEKKEPVFNHLFMTGDSAGSITPLCGNGIALAIHSAKLLSATLLDHWQMGHPNLAGAEEVYTREWNLLFSRRLWAGRQIQNLFGSSLASELAVLMGKYLKPVARGLIHQTHGEPFS